ncbi:sugar phosphate nucleotidyltransferase, partial [Helicobacter pylori]
MKIKNILLSGGSGKRLWPLSRSLYPKQFLKLFDHKSLFELSFKRNASLVDETLIA